VLRVLRPLAGRSALTATLVSRLVPVAAADAVRLRDAARLRGPGAAAVGTAPLARRLLAGSFDRAVDVAATLELRGYGLDAPRVRNRRLRSRYDRRFYAVAAVLLAAAIVGKALGADDFHTYPSVEIGVGPTTAALSTLVALSGLAPLKRRRRRVTDLSPMRKQNRHSPEVARV
jgi:energy-coupling factor transport system permease protein